MHNKSNNKSLKVKRKRYHHKNRRSKNMSEQQKDKMWYHQLSANFSCPKAIFPEDTKSSTQKTDHSSKSQSASSQPSTSSFANGIKTWTQIYQNLVAWHSENQVHFWRQRVQYLESENAQLRMQLGNKNDDTHHHCRSTLDDYETSSGEEEQADAEEVEEADDENGVDPGYLDFLAITMKHREELRLKREAEAEAEAEAEMQEAS